MPDASQPSDPASPDSQRESLFVKKKSMLTHAAARKPELDSGSVKEEDRGGDAEVKRIEEGMKEVRAAIPAEPAKTDGKSGSKAMSPALMERMKTIHSRSPGDKDATDRKRLAQSKSTLPEAMAKVNRENIFQEKLNRAFGNSEASPASDSTLETAYVVDDPSPEFKVAVFHFIFSFGRFANGVQLAQPLSTTFLFFGLCAIGMVLPVLRWVVPAEAGPLPWMSSLFLLQTLGTGIGIGAGVYVGLSLLFNVSVWARFGRVGLLFGLRVVTAAFLPLALVQIGCLLYGGITLGEAFWRGANPEWFRWMQAVVLPALWAWGGFRLAQALVRMVRMPWVRALVWMTLLPIGFAGAYLPLHPVFMCDWRFARLDPDFSKVDAFKASGDYASALEQLSALEAKVPYRCDDGLRSVYLSKIDLFYRLDQVREARAEALKLDYLSLPESQYDHLAKGINLLLQGKRPDLAFERLQNTLELDPDCQPGYVWMLRYTNLDPDVDREPYAKQLYALSPVPEHFSIYMDILYRKQKYTDMWDVMLEQEANPASWGSETLLQGAEAADALGKTKRAERLRKLAGVNDPVPESEVE
jgi:hypothetical protein